MKIIKNNDPILHKVCPHFDGDVSSLKESSEEMFRLLEEEGGLGLSAPQVGLNQRFFVMNVRGTMRVCINPRVLEISNRQELMEEGCLSFPQLWLRIQRPVWVSVSYTDENGEHQEETLEGLESQCFQHELDHLNGITFDIKVSKFALRLAKDRQKKMLKKIKKHHESQSV